MAEKELEHECPSQIVEEFRSSQVKFLLADLDLAMTFAEVARSPDRPVEVRERNLENARTSYETVERLAKTVTLQASEREELSARIRMLRNAIDRVEI